MKGSTNDLRANPYLSNDGTYIWKQWDLFRVMCKFIATIMQKLLAGENINNIYSFSRFLVEIP